MHLHSSGTQALFPGGHSDSTKYYVFYLLESLEMRGKHYNIRRRGNSTLALYSNLCTYFANEISQVQYANMQRERFYFLQYRLVTPSVYFEGDTRAIFIGLGSRAGGGNAALACISIEEPQ